MDGSCQAGRSALGARSDLGHPPPAVQRLRVVGDQQDRTSVPGQPVEEAVGQGCVEVGGGLVEEEDVGVAEQRTGHPDPGPLAGGETLPGLTDPAVQPDGPQDPAQLDRLQDGSGRPRRRPGDLHDPGDDPDREVDEEEVTEEVGHLVVDALVVLADVGQRLHDRDEEGQPTVSETKKKWKMLVEANWNLESSTTSMLSLVSRIACPSVPHAGDRMRPVRGGTAR